MLFDIHAYNLGSNCAEWPSAKTLTFYPVGTRFESLLWAPTALSEFFVYYISPSRQITGQYHETDNDCFLLAFTIYNVETWYPNLTLNNLCR